MNKTLISVVTAGDLLPGVFETLYQQDDKDPLSILIHVEKPSIENENPYFKKALNCALNRNFVRQMLLATDATHFFFVDSDTIAPKHALRIMKSHNKDIVGGWCEIIGTGIFAVADSDLGGVLNYKELQPGLRKVSMVGLGCILMKRQVLEALNFQPGHEDKIFSKTINKETVKGTSLDFCERAHAHGFEVYAEGNVLCHHIPRGKK